MAAHADETAELHPFGKRTRAVSRASSPLDHSAYYASHQPPPPRQAATARHGPSRLLAPLDTECQPSGSPGDYSPRIVDSPRTASSDALMEDRPNATPSVTPPDADSPGRAADQLARLSVDHGKAAAAGLPPDRGRTPQVVSSLKRSPSSELPRPTDRQSPDSPNLLANRFSEVHSPRFVGRHQQKRLHGSAFSSRPQPSHEARFGVSVGQPVNHAFAQSKVPCPIGRDSGYESTPSRAGTLQQPAFPPSTSAMPSALPYDLVQGQTVQRHNGLIQLPANSRYPGLILQPDSCPISQEQLGAEVKGIYAGLVMVEAKCINMDATQAANPQTLLGPSQWQALIALHRTLLYEHHDFLMATQHPSASNALRGLATKYSMPARMWKHGIHAFLEVLRHRRPDSQDYMLAFIYLAYQMMALLFETVPSFADTWIECLGDLARYRMAIEEEREPHATWGGVAARWYTMASDRHPAIGRLYHHLGILERPSLRKLCLYAKSLTCVIPFANARDSLTTLCAPIIQDEEAIESSSQNMEARTVTFYALVYSGHQSSTVGNVAADALQLIHSQPAKLKENAAYLAFTNIAALFEFGLPTNGLWQVYANAISQTIQSSRPTASSDAYKGWQAPSTSGEMSPVLSFGTKFCSACFNLILRREDNRSRLNNSLPFAYVMLGWLHSLCMVRTRLVGCGVSPDAFEHWLEPVGFSWSGLADFLNSLAHHESIHPRILEFARQGKFPASQRKQDARPLAEDYLIRGSMWCQFYFVPGWFDGQTEEDGRAIETPSMQKARAERVLWLGLFLAFHTGYISYDMHTQRFSAAAAASATRQSAMHESSAKSTARFPAPGAGPMLAASSPVATSPKAPSSSSPSEDGFTVVRKFSVPPSYADMAAKQPKQPPVLQRPPKKSRQETVVKVHDEDFYSIDTRTGFPDFP